LQKQYPQISRSYPFPPPPPPPADPVIASILAGLNSPLPQARDIALNALFQAAPTLDLSRNPPPSRQLVDLLINIVSTGRDTVDALEQGGGVDGIILSLTPHLFSRAVNSDDSKPLFARTTSEAALISLHTLSLAPQNVEPLAANSHLLALISRLLAPTTATLNLQSLIVIELLTNLIPSLSFPDATSSPRPNPPPPLAEAIPDLLLIFRRFLRLNAIDVISSDIACAITRFLRDLSYFSRHERAVGANLDILLTELSSFISIKAQHAPFFQAASAVVDILARVAASSISPPPLIFAAEGLLEGCVMHGLYSPAPDLKRKFLTLVVQVTSSGKGGGGGGVGAV
jgi:hypothetical protein